MSNLQIQMGLLSEDRDPLETLHYAITRERGQENQQRISNTHAKSPNGSGINLIQLPTPFEKYPHLCTCIGKSKNHIAKSTFHNSFHPTQHKGRRVPLNLIENKERVLNKLLEDKFSDEYFISPVIITVKHDKSIKIVLDSKKLNEAIHKNKYQMQSIDHLMDTIACKISEPKQKTRTL